MEEEKYIGLNLDDPKFPIELFKFLYENTLLASKNHSHFVLFDEKYRTLLIKRKNNPKMILLGIFYVDRGVVFEGYYPGLFDVTFNY